MASMDDSTNAIPIITRLPTETLMEVFEHLVTDVLSFEDSSRLILVESSRRTLTEVCSWWRELAINHAALWTVIYYVEYEKIRTARNWTRICLARSNNRDIQVAVILDWRANVVHKRYGAGFRSFFGTLDDDLPRIHRFSVSDISAMENANSLALVPDCINELTARYDGLWGFSNCRFQLLRRLKLRVQSLSRQDLSDLFCLCPGLQHFTLQTSAGPRHCMAGQSMYPSIFAPELVSLGLHDTIVPARAFLAPNLVELVSCPSAALGQERFWWETNHCRIGTPSHQEDVPHHHFPQLRNLTVGMMQNNPDWLEPSVRLIQAHPEIRQLTLLGSSGTDALLQRAYTLDQGGTLPPSLARIFVYGRDPLKCHPNLIEALRVILTNAEAHNSPSQILWTRKPFSGWFQKRVPFEDVDQSWDEENRVLDLLEEEFRGRFKVCDGSEARDYFLEGFHETQIYKDR